MSANMRLLPVVGACGWLVTEWCAPSATLWWLLAVGLAALGSMAARVERRVRAGDTLDWAGRLLIAVGEEAIPNCPQEGQDCGSTDNTICDPLGYLDARP